MLNKDLLIGEAAAKTGLAPKTIRYYEEVGLIPQPRRRRTGYASAGYRLYSEQDVERLRLIKGARLLDLSLAEIRQLLSSLTSLNGRTDRHRLDLVLREKLAAIDTKIKELQLLRDRLEHIKDVMEQEKVEAQESCCDPLCGPDICPPTVVTIEGPRRGEAKTKNTSDRR
ncbi:MerR family transcriptional regulator [Acidobacteria bacterium AH-259-O06]|nr:MerR family transcriptional regulator [Acidobacteria bacterium AH-259-O06]